MTSRYGSFALAVLVTAGLGAAACGGDDHSATPSSGGNLTFAMDTEPSCLDPQVSGLDAAALIDRNIVDSLVSMGQDGSFHPWLAQSWKISGKGRTYTFTLRSGAKFQDGTAVDATAVKATFDHAVDPKAKSQYAASLISSYDGAKVVNPSTVQVDLSRPDSSFLQAVSTASLGIQSPTALKAGTTCQHPVGSGPFQLAAWNRKQNLILKRNPAYAWGPADGGHSGPARLDSVTISFITENAVRLGALTSGQAQVVADVAPNNTAAVEHSGTARLMRHDAPGAAYTLYFNTGRAPLDDEKVRQALQRSVDLDKLVNAVYRNKYTRAWSVLSPATPDYDPKTKNMFAFDPAAAGRLLDQAGWTGRDSQGYRTKNGKRLTIRWPYLTLLMREQRDIVGEGIKAQAKQVGIDIERISEDTGPYARDHATGNADIWDSSSARADAGILRTLFGSDMTAKHGGYNVFGLKDARIDQLLDQAAATQDGTVERQAYDGVQEYVNQHALALPVYAPASLLGVSKKVHDLGSDGNSFPMFATAWLG